MAATVGGKGGKRTIFFTQISGDHYVGTESSWNPGNVSGKKRTGKDHKVRTGKDAMRKCNTHKGSVSHAA